LTDPPDLVTFSKKAQAAGYYFGNSELRPNKAYRTCLSPSSCLTQLSTTLKLS